MRIITGLARGCKLKTPKGRETRPTADRVKESLFNILGGTPADALVLDIFAGTGNLGLEALSRGAAQAVFVDQSLESIQLIQANAEHTHLAANAEIIKSDVFAALQRLERAGRKFSLVFCDPPYHKDLCQRALRFFDQSTLLTDGALLIVEHARDDALPNDWLSLELVRNQTYGATTQISIFRYRRADVKEGEQ